MLTSTAVLCDGASSVASQVYTVPFVLNDKPVFNAEYRKDYGVCPESIALGIDTIFKVWAEDLHRLFPPDLHRAIAFIISTPLPCLRRPGTMNIDDAFQEF